MNFQNKKTRNELVTLPWHSQKAEPLHFFGGENPEKTGGVITYNLHKKWPVFSIGTCFFSPYIHRTYVVLPSPTPWNEVTINPCHFRGSLMIQTHQFTIGWRIYFHLGGSWIAFLKICSKTGPDSMPNSSLPPILPLQPSLMRKTFFFRMGFLGWSGWSAGFFLFFFKYGCWTPKNRGIYYTPKMDGLK